MTYELLRQLYEAGLKQIRTIIDIAKEIDVTDNQDFLNFLDELNSMSVEY